MATLVGRLTPMVAGEIRTFIVKAKSETTVWIKCFVQPPTPPVYRGCRECGVLPRTLQPGSQLEVVGPSSLTGTRSGIEIRLAEIGAEDIVYHILVLRRDEGENASQILVMS